MENKKIKFNYIKPIFNDKGLNVNDRNNINVKLLKKHNFNDYVDINSNSHLGKITVKYYESGVYVYYTYKGYSPEYPKRPNAVSKYYPYLVYAETELNELVKQLKIKVNNCNL